MNFFRFAWWYIDLSKLFCLWTSGIRKFDIWEKSCHPAYISENHRVNLSEGCIINVRQTQSHSVWSETNNKSRTSRWSGISGAAATQWQAPFFTVLMTPGCCIVCPARRRAASNIADEKASLMMQLWQMRRRRQKNAEIHLSELAPLIIEERSHFDGDFMPRRGRKFAWLNEVFDLKQKAFSHASPVFSYCSGSSAFDKFV